MPTFGDTLTPFAAGRAKVFGVTAKDRSAVAIAYHFINDFDTAPDIMMGIREAYDGPLTLAKDMLV